MTSVDARCFNRLALNGAFWLINHKAFRIEANTFRLWESDPESLLSVKKGTITIEDSQIRVSLSPDFEIKEMILNEAFVDALPLTEAASCVWSPMAETSLPFSMV